MSFRLLLSKSIFTLFPFPQTSLVSCFKWMSKVRVGKRRLEFQTHNLLRASRPFSAAGERCMADHQDENAENLNKKIAGLQSEIAHMQRRNRLILDMSPDLVFISDKDLKFQFVNQSAAAYVGLSPGEPVGKTFADVFPNDVTQHLNKRARQVFAGG